MLGQTIGLRGAISVGLLIGGLSALWLIFSPVRKLEKIEEQVHGAHGEVTESP
jgi:hypothetical protein